MYNKLASISMQLPLFLFFVNAIMMTSLHSMNRLDELMEIIILNADHHEQRTYAVLNKTYNKIIEDTYRQKKQCIELVMREKGTPLIQGQVSWNKDFSRCAWATIKQNNSKSPEKILELTLVGLKNKDTIIGIHQTFDNFYFPAIEDEKCPFFDTNGAACFYGYAKVPTYTSHGDVYCTEHVVRFSINFNNFGNQVKRQRCSFDFGQIEYEFRDIFNFPVLLKSFLQSTQVDENAYESFTLVDWKVCSFEGVIFPENYKIFKKHTGAEEYLTLLRATDKKNRSSDLFLLSAELPNRFKEAIDKRYEAQQQETMKIEEK